MWKKILLIGCLLLSSSLPGWCQTGPAEPAPAEIETNNPDQKNPWVAAGFSVLPGAGQMYVHERIWPDVLITIGVLSALGLFLFFDQQRSGSISERTINPGQTQRLPDAHWDALTLAFQIAVPSLWLWNMGDAYRQAEIENEKVIRELDSNSNAYIMKENLVSVTLWQF